MREVFGRSCASVDSGSGAYGRKLSKAGFAAWSFTPVRLQNWIIQAIQYTWKGVWDLVTSKVISLRILQRMTSKVLVAEKCSPNGISG
jgi:hypothetical protein